MLHEGSVANYMDNFIIPEKTEKELEERTVKFLKTAEKHNLCFKQIKCEFDATEICHSCARTSGSVLYGLPLHQKDDVNKATW